MIRNHRNLDHWELNDLQSKMSADSMRMVAETIDGFEKDFPRVVDGIASIYVYDKPNAYACARTNGREIGINPKLMGDIKELEKGYASDLRIGWHPAGTTAKNIIDHELGHILVTRIAQFEYINRDDLAKRIVGDACKAVRANSGGVKGLTKAKLVPEISRYAKTNDHETIAEAVADYRANGENAKRLSVEIYKLLQRRAKGVGLV